MRLNPPTGLCSVGGESRSVQLRGEVGVGTPRFEIQELIDPLAVLSEIIFLRLKCVECNPCEPCGPEFMGALQQLAKAGGRLAGEERGE